MKTKIQILNKTFFKMLLVDDEEEKKLKDENLAPNKSIYLF